MIHSDSSKIVTDPVGAEEIAGVSKLLFSSCSVSTDEDVEPGDILYTICVVDGAEPGDNVMASLNSTGNICIEAVDVSSTSTGIVTVALKNDYSGQNPPYGEVSILVFKI